MDHAEDGVFRIAPGESEAFALLSGDHNPLHLDPVVARRLLFGGTVVHGVHALLAALDGWAGRHGRAFALRAARGNFSGAIPTGSVVHWSASDSAGKLDLQLRGPGGLAQRLLLRYEAAALASAASVGEYRPPATAPAALTFQQAAGHSGETRVGCDPALCEALFPHLHRWMAPSQLAALLATTRIVGMECPGLNSIFTGVALEFPPDGEGRVIAHTVDGSDERYASLSIRLESAVVRGRLTALYRPGPTRQSSFEELSRQVRAGELDGQRAIILGGSRGLGEVTAKLLAAGGGEAWITHATGASDAAAVASEIAAHGGRARSFPFDVLDPPRALPPALTGLPAPTHVYYFATPRIPLNSTGAWQNEVFQRLSEFYVAGLSRSLQAMRSWWPDAALAVYYPSTVFVEHARAGAAEYAAAKAAGETLCRYLEASSPPTRVHVTRLPRLLTDQTNGPGAGEGDRSVAAGVMLEILRQMHGAPTPGLGQDFP